MITRIELDTPEDFLDYRIATGQTAEICNIVVHSERMRGRGRRLVELLLDSLSDDIKLVYAITRISNETAQQFYTALGFQRLGCLFPFYLDNREAAVVYGRQLCE